MRKSLDFIGKTSFICQNIWLIVFQIINGHNRNFFTFEFKMTRCIDSRFRVGWKITRWKTRYGRIFKVGLKWDFEYFQVGNTGSTVLCELWLQSLCRLTFLKRDKIGLQLCTPTIFHSDTFLKKSSLENRRHNSRILAHWYGNCQPIKKLILSFWDYYPFVTNGLKNLLGTG